MSKWWDSHCHNCGLCCHEKHYTAYWHGVPSYGHPGVSKRFFIDKEDPCEFLRADCRCSIYSQRFKKNPNCVRLTLFHALFSGYLPAECGYVKKFRPWRRRS